jgi:hypothetical protein
LIYHYFGDYISLGLKIGADMQNESMPMIRRTRFKTMKRNPLALKLRAKQEESFLKISKNYGNNAEKKSLI